MPKRMAVIAIDEELLPRLMIKQDLDGGLGPAVFSYTFVAVGDQTGTYVVRKNTTSEIRIDGSIDKMLEQLDNHLSVSLDPRAVQPEGG